MYFLLFLFFFFFQAEDGIRDAQESRGLGDVYKRQLYYAVTKKPEQTDPLDPAKGLTGHQQYCLTEVYKGQEGCDAHFKEGMAAEDMFKEFQRVCKEHTKLHIMFADVVHTM
eukprot:TRINITY_DN474_c0_g1_i2.p2 TRINITY_DN474_c0_g1~~TRINITY_DN474_c0_g1_i2.p2  ORF type:complete len:112 (+),score=46.76 TRINITY_DN474_c0_g1_i2:52-387(+)